jgi:hypothetical protein
MRCEFASQREAHPKPVETAVGGGGRLGLF